MTENLKIGVSVHLLNPSGFVAQKNRPETNRRAALAGGDEKQVFAVTLRRRHHDVKNGVTACSASKADPGCSSFVPLCVPEGQFVSSGHVFESIRMSGVFTPRRLEQRRCRWRDLDTSARTTAGACRQASACASAAASGRRVWSTASADA